MNNQKDLTSLGGQRLKNAVSDILLKEHWQENITELIEIHGAKLSNSFFSISYSESSLLSYRAIRSFHILAKYLILSDKEKVRVLIRKCIWMLTEESGGIPWRIPEIIGEIMSSDKQIAEDYVDLLFSYINENELGFDNYLEHTPLRISVYKAIENLSEFFPEIILKRNDILEQRINAETEPEIILYLCLIISNIIETKFNFFLEKQLTNNNQIELYCNDKIVFETISSVASKLLAFMSN